MQTSILELRENFKNFKSLSRTIFIVCGLTITIWNINVNLQIYLKFITKTEMGIETNERAALPYITICLNSMHSLGKHGLN